MARLRRLRLFSVTTFALRKAAADHEVYVLFCVKYKRDDKERPFERLLVIDPRGKVVHRYDKLWADARFTDSFVRSRIGKGQGPQRIRAELAQRGITDDEADGVLRAADVDWLETIRAVRAKRFGPELPRDYAERARQARFLQYRGFDSAQIRAALEFDVDSD